MAAATNEKGSGQAATTGLAIVYKLGWVAMEIYQAIRDCDPAKDKYQEGAYREEGAQAQAMVRDQEAVLIIEEGEARILQEVVHLSKGQSAVS